MILFCCECNLNIQTLTDKHNLVPDFCEEVTFSVLDGVPLVVSSDAHFAGNVGEVSVAVELLEKHGIPEESVLNADEKRFAAKISEITGRTFDVFG